MNDIRERLDTHAGWILDRIAIAGALLWCGSWFYSVEGAIGIPIVERVVALGALVAAPMALAQAWPKDPTPGLRDAAHAALVLQFPASVCALVCIFVPLGPDSAGISSFWLAQTLALACVGALRLRAVFPDVGETAISMGLIYVPTGAAWLLASRLELRPMGFPPAIVLLTAAHFHFAGMSASVIAGSVGRLAQEGRGLLRAGIIGVTFGPILVALGITLSPTIEVASAITLALAMLLVAGYAIGVAPKLAGNPGWVLATAHLVLLVTMSLAIVFAVGEFTGHPWVSIPGMAAWHGLVNALGYGILGLAGARWIANRATGNSTEPPDASASQ